MPTAVCPVFPVIGRFDVKKILIRALVLLLVGSSMTPILVAIYQALGDPDRADRNREMME